MPKSSPPAPEGPASAISAGRPWNRLAASQGVLLILLIGFLYYRIVVKLVLQWANDPNYSHGFLIVIFSFWIVWHERKHLADVPIKPSRFGFFVIVGGMVILVLGVFGAENFLSRTSLLLVLAGMIIYFRGWRFFRAVLFPWASLFLMIPIPSIVFNQAALPLQFQASKLASSLLGLVGVPVFREGNIIHLPSITLDVAEACAGIRSLVSLYTLALVYGYFFEPRISRRALLTLSAVPIAVIANGFRIMGTGILGEYWSSEKAEGFFHSFSALLIFLVSIGLLLAFHKALSWLGRPTTAREV